MKQLIIIGAGGYGREVLTMAIDNPDNGVFWQVKGFLDNRRSLLDGFASRPESMPDAITFTQQERDRYRRDFAILGDPLTYTPAPDDVFLCALGSPADRRQYTAPILANGGEFIRLVHPNTAVSAFAAIGTGSIVGPYASLSPDSRVGRFASVSSYTALAHDVVVGDWTEIGGHCLIAGGVTIGEGVRIHPGAVLTPGVRIGDGATVAAGSVVFGDVPRGLTVLGNPARRFDWKS
jgi:sugar O-acyltransferase (sialic acid O-acetyltransferase NeuD family)